jgi:hypothetical protein
MLDGTTSEVLTEMKNQRVTGEQIKGYFVNTSTGTRYVLISRI